MYELIKITRLNFKRGLLRMAVVYPASKSSFSQMCYRAIAWHLTTLKKIFIYLLLAVILKVGYLGLKNYELSALTLTLLQFVTVLLITFFAAAALYSADKSFKGAPVSFWGGFKGALKRMMHVYLALFLYVAGVILVRYFARFLMVAIAKLIDEPSVVHGGMLIVTTALVLVFVAMFCFALPLCVVEKKSVRRAFYESMFLSDCHKYGVFILFTMILVMLLVLTPNLIIHWKVLSVSYWDALFNLVFLAVIFPFFLNLLMLIMNDGMLQMKQEDI